jgi:HPt (histidine-containing phosphotransfer) domain-containing protein
MVCREAGMADVVIKPFPSSQLFHAMAKVLPQAEAPGPGAEEDFTPPPGLNNALKASYEEFGPEYTVKLVARSVLETVRLVKSLEDGFAAKDYEAVQKNAHNLKSVAGYIGLTRIQAAAGEIERSCVQKNTAPLPPLIQEISALVRQEIPEVEEVVKKVKA